MTRKQTIIALILAIPLLLATRCESSQETKDVMAVIKQQMHFAIKQPIPFFNWSLERSLLIQLYQIRNKQVATHSVLRGDTSVIEFDCPSIGYGMPYDTSLTNPWMATDEAPDGIDKTSLAAIGQAEPNGIFASTNTSATWIFCVDEDGKVTPVYAESKVTVFPFPMEVDYENNRVYPAGRASVTVDVDQPDENSTPSILE